MTSKKLQKIYREYISLSKINDAADDAMVENPEDASLEAAADEAYNNYWNKREELVKALFDLIHCDRQTANAMICSDKFEALMSMTIC